MFTPLEKGHLSQKKAFAIVDGLTQDAHDVMYLSNVLRSLQEFGEHSLYFDRFIELFEGYRKIRDRDL